MARRYLSALFGGFAVVPGVFGNTNFSPVIGGDPVLPANALTLNGQAITLNGHTLTLGA